MSFIESPGTSVFKTKIDISKISVVTYASTIIKFNYCDGSENTIPKTSTEPGQIEKLLEDLGDAGFIINTIDPDLPIKQAINLKRIISNTNVNNTSNPSLEGGASVYQIVEPSLVKAVEDYIRFN